PAHARRRLATQGGTEPGALCLQPETSVGGGGIEKTAGGAGELHTEGQTQREPCRDWVRKAAPGPPRAPLAWRRVATLNGNLARPSNAADPSMNPHSIFHTGSEGRAPGGSVQTRRNISRIFDRCASPFDRPAVPLVSISDQMRSAITIALV